MADGPIGFNEFQSWLIKGTKIDRDMKNEVATGNYQESLGNPRPDDAEHSWNRHTMSQNLRRMQYAVRGEVVIKADASKCLPTSRRRMNLDLESIPNNRPSGQEGQEDNIYQYRQSARSWAKTHHLLSSSHIAVRPPGRMWHCKSYHFICLSRGCRCARHRDEGGDWSGRHRGVY